MNASVENISLIVMTLSRHLTDSVGSNWMDMETGTERKSRFVPSKWNDRVERLLF